MTFLEADLLKMLQDFWESSCSLVSTNTVYNYYIAIIMLLICDSEKYFYFFNTVTDRDIECL